MPKVSLKRQQAKHDSEPEVELPSMIVSDKKMVGDITLYPKDKRRTITSRRWRLECAITQSYLYSHTNDKFYYRTKTMALFQAWRKHHFAYPSYDVITLIHQPSEGMLKT